MSNNLALKQDCCSNYNNINENIEIITYFQPIISIKNEHITGFESLCRGVCKHCGRIILPCELFSKITNEKSLFELDILSRKSALSNFDKFLKENNKLLLFINFDVSLIEKKIENPDSLIKLLEIYNINPQNIVIEITESKPCNIIILSKFLESFRNHGFLIALDDVGTGYSNFDRILIIKPDILKIDRSIIKNINKEHNKKAVFTTLSDLSRKIGTFILAEGVETEDELICSMELDAELVQGFYFYKTQEPDKSSLKKVNDKIIYASNKCKNNKSDKIKDFIEKNQLYSKSLCFLSELLSTKTFNNMDEIELFLNSYTQNYDFIESLYIIDCTGTQITDTILNNNVCLRRKIFYNPRQKGDSHSHKEYFYYLKNDIYTKFLSASFISLTTGNLCKTFSLRFKNKEKDKFYIICMDIKEDALNSC